LHISSAVAGYRLNGWPVFVWSQYIRHHTLPFTGRFSMIFKPSMASTLVFSC
jgi:hypothetical protein